MSVGLCKRIALEALRVEVHTSNARMIRSRRPVLISHEMLPPSDSLSVDSGATRRVLAEDRSSWLEG